MKRKLERKAESSKRAKLDNKEGDDNLSPEDKIRLSTIPLWNMPYKDQVSKYFKFTYLIVTISNQN